MRHVNIPIFIPHLGCPNQCVFCNQRAISGVREFKAEEVIPTIEAALLTVCPEDECEIAFFGGSFTGIDRTLMTELLEISYSYLKRGLISSVRCSTRPDYINPEILDILEQYGVRTVELGLQSSSDSVLALTKRGHTGEDELRACKLITDRGFELVGQMMIGLPGSTPESELETAELIIKAGARAARIYPTVVFRETELCAMTEAGIYNPLSLEEAVERSAAVYERFHAAGTEVIRIGLHSSENLSSRESYYAGPNHPAIGELVLGEVYYKKIIEKAKALVLSPESILSVYVPKGELSKAVGQRKRNKLRLAAALGIKSVKFTECAELSLTEISLGIE